jgi:uncharacterized damage-inducible protein DinB
MTAFWDDLWAKNMWWPAFDLSFKDLSAEHAAWKPAPGRHSIWQILNHICFWREVVVGRLEGKEPAADELERRNFEEPVDRSDDAWKASLDRFTRSQQLVRGAVESGKLTEDRFRFLVPHDAYHVGQVMYIRALLGREPIAYE